MLGTIRLRTIGSFDYHDVFVNGLTEGFGTPTDSYGLDETCYKP